VAVGGRGGGRRVRRRERRKGQRAATDAGAMRARNTTACEKYDGGVRVHGGLAQQVCGLASVSTRVEDKRTQEIQRILFRARGRAGMRRARGRDNLGRGPLAGLRGFSFFFIWLFFVFFGFCFLSVIFVGSMVLLVFWFFILLSVLVFFLNFNFLFENFDI
jgi:hypothetical protein